jgi:hypothetical protein
MVILFPYLPLLPYTLKSFNPTMVIKSESKKQWLYIKVYGQL